MAARAGVDALILAGGEARRMGGGDKGLLDIGGRTILARIVATLQPQCDHVLLSAKGDAARFAALDLPIVADDVVGRGPLGGLLAGLEWTARHRPATHTLLSVPGDTPFLPHDLVVTLVQARDAPDTIVMASTRGRVHPTVALWPLALRAPLRAFLAESTRYSVKAFAACHGVVHAAWPDVSVDPFANINTPEDLAWARAQAGSETN